MGDAVAGEALFVSKLCSSCHTPHGDGTFGPPGDFFFDINNLQHTTLENIVDFIDENMPKLIAQPSTCVDECAEDTAAYLMTFVAGETAGTAEDFGGYTIAPIADCATSTTPSGDKLAVFNQNSNQISGFWTHVPNSAAEFGNLETAAYNDQRFNLSQIAAASDPSCGGNMTYTGTFVKKFVDWDHQHSNGGTFGLNKNVGTLDAVILDVKVNSADTNLPTPSELDSAFGSFATASELDAVDDQNVAFAIGVSNGGNGSGYTGQTFIEIDMAKYADQWIRITIPVEDMAFQQDANWSKVRDVPYSEAQTINMSSFFINAETLSDSNKGGVLRGTYDDTWSWDANNGNPWPNEMFKEQNISIKAFELLYK